MNKNILIDGGNLLHRAFNVFTNRDDGRVFSSDSGYPTGMIYGPLSMLSDWASLFGGFDSVHFFCDGNPARRLAMDPSYKGKDEEKKIGSPIGNLKKFKLTLPDGYEASGEIDILLHVLQLLGVSVYHDRSEEADDLIASFIKSRPDDTHVIVSPDRDFYQLLTNPRVVIFNSGKKRFLDAEGAEEDWASLHKGKHPRVSPSAVRMFKTLCGDSSDNIPGIMRLRKRVAAQISDSPTVTLDKLKSTDWPGLSDLERKRAREMHDRLKLNWELIGLVDDLPVEPLPGPPMDEEIASAVLRSLNIHIATSSLVPRKARSFIGSPSIASIFDPIEI